MRLLSAAPVPVLALVGYFLLLTNSFAGIEQESFELDTFVREQRYVELFKKLQEREGSPASMLPWLQQHAEAGHVPVQFEFSKALATQDPSNALKWFAIARVGATLDAVLCEDKTAGSAVSAFIMAYGQYIRSSMTPAGYKIAVEQALQWHNQHPRRPSPLWICSHGMQAFTTGVRLIPESQWTAVQQTTKDKIRASLSEKR